MDFSTLINLFQRYKIGLFSPQLLTKNFPTSNKKLPNYQ